MIAVALAQIRIHWARFLAIGLSIALAAGFVATTLIINASLQDHLRESVGKSFSHADLAIIPGQDEFVDGTEAAPLLEPLSEVEGVSSADLSARTLTTGRGIEFSESTFALAPTPVDPRLDAFTIIDGHRPDAVTDLALDSSTADTLNIGIGDKIRLAVDTVPVETGDDDIPIYRSPSESTSTFTVVGIVDIGEDPAIPGANRVLTTAASYHEFFAQRGDVIAVQIALEDSANAAQTRRQLQKVLDSSGLGGRVELLGVDEATKVKTQRLSGSNDVITAMMLIFAGIAVIVAVLVVSNTFSVIVAGRRRELALLRCLGASRAQIYSSVVAEGLLVGLIGSAVGVLGGVGLSFGLAAGARRILPEEFSHASVEVPLSSLLTGVGVGALLTILATIRPARSAISVTPLEALQPFDISTAPSFRSRPRAIIGWASILAGVLLIIASLYLVSSEQSWILGGAVGGALIVTGLVVCSAQIIPPIVAWIGDLLFSPWGIPGQLATLNTLRNPRRTATTATALIIGVTLVATILVGGISTKATLGHGLDQRYPIDVSVPLANAVDEDTLDDVADIEGVDRAVVAYRAVALDDFKGSRPDVYVLSPETARFVLSEGAPDLVAGEVVVPEDYPNQTIRIKGLNDKAVPVTKTGRSSLAFFTTTDVGNDLGISATATSVLIRLDEAANIDEVFRIQHDVAEVLDVPSDEVGGSAVARGTYSKLIDVLLAGAVALLLVAVLIALIGVSNTVSLSVIERRRENALMRALGLSISQLRALLALEAVLISSVAALIGLILGGALGIAGTRLLTADYSTDLIVDWSPTAYLGILVVAIVAGILSALSPAKRAARLSPVEGLKLDY